MYKLEFGEELCGFCCFFFFSSYLQKKVIQRPGSNLYKRVRDPAMILEKNKTTGAPRPSPANTHTRHTDACTVTKSERKALHSPPLVLNEDKMTKIK